MPGQTAVKSRGSVAAFQQLYQGPTKGDRLIYRRVAPSPCRDHLSDWPGDGISGAPAGLERLGGYKPSNPPDDRNLDLPERLAGLNPSVTRVEILEESAWRNSSLDNWSFPAPASRSKNITRYRATFLALCRD